jgi:beta-glucosidase
VLTGGGSGRVFGFAPVSVLQGVSDRLGLQSQVTYAGGIRSLKALSLTTRFTPDANSKVRGVRVETFPDENLSGPPSTQRIEPRFATGTAGFGTELFAAIDELPTEEVLAQLSEQMGRPATFERWSANLTPEAGGRHTVFVQCSLRYRLLIDGRVVIDSSRSPRAALRQVHLELDASPHSVVLEQMGRPELGKPFWRVGIVHEDSFVDPAAVELAKRADAVVLAVGFNSDVEGEALDREFILPPGQVELINAIAAANKRTVVVLNSGGSVDVSSWLDRVPALLAAWFPGQEGGTAVAQLLFGDASPSGRLPISWERRLEDNPSNDSYYFNDAAHPNRVAYTDGIFVGYRGLQRAKVVPAFPFGFGLSYATFAYGDVKVSPATGAGTGGRTAPAFEVSFNLTNIGSKHAADVAQIYVAPRNPRVPRPIRELKGFSRVEVAPGTTKQVKIMLDARAFAYFDVNRQRWQVDAGDYAVEIGRSADDIRETVRVEIKRPTSLSVRD